MIPDRTGKAELSPVLKLPSLTILAQATTQHGDSESCIGGSAVTQRVSIDSALVYGYMETAFSRAGALPRKVVPHELPPWISWCCG